MTDTWDPAQYDKFQREREQPFFDLLAMVRPRAGMQVVDLGCGTGALTRLAHEQLHARGTLGIDRSARMLEDARRAELPAGLGFEVGDIRNFSAEPRLSCSPTSSASIVNGCSGGWSKCGRSFFRLSGYSVGEGNRGACSKGLATGF